MSFLLVERIENAHLIIDQFEPELVEFHTLEAQPPTAQSEEVEQKTELESEPLPHPGPSNLLPTSANESTNPTSTMPQTMPVSKSMVKSSSQMQPQATAEPHPTPDIPALQTAGQTKKSVESSRAPTASVALSEASRAPTALVALSEAPSVEAPALGQFDLNTEEHRKDQQPNVNVISFNFTGKAKLWLKSGCSYEGDFLNGFMHGQGIFHWPDNVSYEGEFNKNRMYGHGRYIW